MGAIDYEHSRARSPLAMIAVRRVWSPSMVGDTLKNLIGGFKSLIESSTRRLGSRVKSGPKKSPHPLSRMEANLIKSLIAGAA